MSSLATRIARGQYGINAKSFSVARRGKSNNPHRNADSLGYEVCHFTKGWRRISFKRLRIQHEMARRLGA